MDHVDAMIVRELTFHPADPRAPARGLRRARDAARALRLPGPTVARRLAALRASGQLQGVFLRPAPALVHRRVAELLLTYPDVATKRRALPVLREAPTLWSYQGHVGRTVAVSVAAPEGRDPLDLGRALGADTQARRVAFHHEAGWPAPSEGVTPADLRVLAAFADDALRPVGSAAREIGVSPRAVASRLRALARLRAFDVHVAIDFERVTPGVGVRLDVGFAPGGAARVHAGLAQRFPLALRRTLPGDEGAAIVVLVQSADELEDQVATAESIPHVLDVQPRILRESFHEPARWQDALLAASPVPR